MNGPKLSGWLWAALTLVQLTLATVPAWADIVSVPIGALANANIRTYTGGANYPVAPTELTVGNIPFNLVPLGTTPNSLGVIQTPAGQSTFPIPANVPGPGTVYTLMNSVFGSVGANIATIEFHGANGAFATFDLIEGTNIRDHFNGIFNNTIAPGTPTVAFAGARLDRQTFILPPAFASDTLSQIKLLGHGGNPQGQAFLASIAVDPATDLEGDGIHDATDNCLYWTNPNQADVDNNGIGNACECGDQDGSGRVDVGDLVAINRAIFNPSQVTPLCDATGDGRCDVRDIVAANQRIFGGKAYCSRRPSDHVPCFASEPTLEAIDAAIHTAVAEVGPSYDPFFDPRGFTPLTDIIERELRCSVLEASTLGAMDSTTATEQCDTENFNYCGPGKKAKSNFFNRNPAVVNSLNQACCEHDNCYSERCVTGGLSDPCLWSPATQEECDLPFIPKCDAAEAEVEGRSDGEAILTRMVCRIIFQLATFPTGTCQHYCDDDSECTTDVCNAGPCLRVPSTGNTCGLGNGCMAGAMCVDGLCAAQASACPAADACHLAGTCNVSGSCTPGVAITCPPGDYCRNLFTCVADVGCTITGGQITYDDWENYNGTGMSRCRAIYNNSVSPPNYWSGPYPVTCIRDSCNLSETRGWDICGPGGCVPYCTENRSTRWNPAGCPPLP